MQKRGRFLSFFLALLLLAGVFLPSGANAEGETLQTKITVQKLAFMSDLPSIKNNGLKPDTLGGTPYDKAKYGDVEFTIVKLDKNQVDNSTLKPQEIANKVGEDPTAFGATIVKTGAVNENGQWITDVDLSDGYYVIYESKHPKTTVQPAIPMFLELPLTKPDGTGHITDVFLQAKNKVEPPKITLTKYQKALGKNPDPFENIVFALYQGKPGQGTPVKDSEGKDIFLTTDNKGQIVVSDLLVGDYYLVEHHGEPKVVENPKSHRKRYTYYLDELKDNTTKKASYMVSKWAQNDSNNKYSFSYLSDGRVITPNFPGTTPENTWDKTFTLTNYDKPTIKKECTNSETVGVGDDAEYKVTIPFSDNISDYTKFEYRDVASSKLFIDTDSIVVTLAGNTTLVKDTDYTVTKNADGYTLNFVVNGVLCPKLAKGFYAEVRYKAKVLAPADEKGSITNKVTLTYNTSSLFVDRTSEATTSISLMKYTLTKYDQGRFGLGEWMDNGYRGRGPNLPGAEFIVSRVVNSQTVYLTINDAGIYRWVADKTKAHTFVTDENGQIIFNGMPAGVFTFTEVKAPKGYRLPEDPNTTKQLDVKDKTVEISNEREPEMPVTGSEKLLLIGIGAAALLGIAAIVLVKRKKDE